MNIARLAAIWVLLIVAVIALAYNLAGGDTPVSTALFPLMAGGVFAGIVYAAKRYGGADVTRTVVQSMVGTAFLAAIALGVYTRTWGLAIAMTVVGAIWTIQIVRAQKQKR